MQGEGAVFWGGCVVVCCSPADSQEKLRHHSLSASRHGDRPTCRATSLVNHHPPLVLAWGALWEGGGEVRCGVSRSPVLDPPPPSW